jgi:MFS transporter, DHA1 family, tetracycline resistance protein
MSANRKRSIFPLLGIMVFDHTSLNITFPVLTLIFFDVHSNLFAPETSYAVRSMWYGLCVAVPHIVNIFMAPVLSALSDEFGRKKLLFAGTLGALLFALISGFGIYSGVISLLFLGMIIQGIFSRTNPIAQAVIGDVSPPQSKMRHMGYLQTSISIGAFVGPLLGGYFANKSFFAELNYSLPFFIAAVFAGISCVLLLLFFQETLASKRTVKWSGFNWQVVKEVFTNQQVLQISLVLLLSQISWSMYYQFIPPILKATLGFNSHGLGIFVGMISFWLALATTFGIKIFEIVLPFRQIMLWSLYLVLAGLLMCVAFCLWHKPGQSDLFIWLSAIPIAVGDVVAYSCLTTLYSNAVLPQAQGKVMGMCFIVVAIIWALTGIVGGVLMGIVKLFPLMLAPSGIILALLLLHSGFGKDTFR